MPVRDVKIPGKSRLIHLYFWTPTDHWILAARKRLFTAVRHKGLLQRCQSGLFLHQLRQQLKLLRILKCAGNDLMRHPTQCLKAMFFCRRTYRSPVSPLWAQHTLVVWSEWDLSFRGYRGMRKYELRVWKPFMTLWQRTVVTVGPVIQWNQFG